ncbi:hypothetical protein M231_02874 [Tremella mesenterica]|uniref:Uncharacterized protein n=1 Tax=Tremella mesenterica TaxID=5217 RepID=A0A4Q1BPI5_TREME|nr:uncharacterized protein TREMEDRAFT_61494 [Tremella mesenterica DSM 1558]EIW69731.1 hypothetical protein TREMEDRAFT_61494 [Tremella mesenterica DSM 1558]RXK39819.1 hypothetical protein M231_02874 [Tremella mesenterica]
MSLKDHVARAFQATDHELDKHEKLFGLLRDGIGTEDSRKNVCAAVTNSLVKLRVHVVQDLTWSAEDTERGFKQLEAWSNAVREASSDEIADLYWDHIDHVEALIVRWDERHEIEQRWWNETHVRLNTQTERVVQLLQSLGSKGSSWVQDHPTDFLPYEVYTKAELQKKHDYLEQVTSLRSDRSVKHPRYYPLQEPDWDTFWVEAGARCQSIQASVDAKRALEPGPTKGNGKKDGKRVGGRGLDFLLQSPTKHTKKGSEDPLVRIARPTSVQGEKALTLVDREGDSQGGTVPKPVLSLLDTTDQLKLGGEPREDKFGICRDESRQTGATIESMSPRQSFKPPSESARSKSPLATDLDSSAPTGWTEETGSSNFGQTDAIHVQRGHQSSKKKKKRSGRNLISNSQPQFVTSGPSPSRELSAVDLPTNKELMGRHMVDPEERFTTFPSGSPPIELDTARSLEPPSEVNSAPDNTEDKTLNTSQQSLTAQRRPDDPPSTVIEPQGTGRDIHDEASKDNKTSQSEGSMSSKGHESHERDTDCAVALVPTPNRLTHDILTESGQSGEHDSTGGKVHCSYTGVPLAMNQSHHSAHDPGVPASEALRFIPRQVKLGGSESSARIVILAPSPRRHLPKGVHSLTVAQNPESTHTEHLSERSASGQGKPRPIWSAPPTTRVREAESLAGYCETDLPSNRSKSAHPILYERPEWVEGEFDLSQVSALESIRPVLS